MPEEHERHIPLLANPQPPPTGPETFEEKFKRKFKEQPLVPIGTGLTVVALVSAIVQQRRGHARNMNNWMWARIAFQGFTVAAILGGTIAMGRSPQQVEARTAASAAAHAQQESAEFAARLRLAEEAHAEEEQGASARAEGAKARAEGGPPAGVRLLRHATTASGSAGEQPAGVRGLRHAEPAAGAAGDLPAGVQVLRQQERETDKQSRSWWKLW